VIRSNSLVATSDGPAAMVSGQLCALLTTRGNLRALRREYEGIDDVADAIDLMVATGRKWSAFASAAGSALAPKAEVPAESDDGAELLTTGQAADVLGITARGVRNACAAGRLKATRSSGGDWVIRRVDLPGN
jgi:excisionase family DNA binding protein